MKVVVSHERLADLNAILRRSMHRQCIDMRGKERIQESGQFSALFALSAHAAKEVISWCAVFCGGLWLGAFCFKSTGCMAWQAPPLDFPKVMAREGGAGQSQRPGFGFPSFWELAAGKFSSHFLFSSSATPDIRPHCESSDEAN